MTPLPSPTLLSNLMDRSYRDLRPLHVSLEITLRCNLRCRPCYNFDRTSPRPPDPLPELSLPTILHLMADLRTAGTLFLSLTGGEPMLHPRFWDILEAAAARRFALTLLTNGTCMENEAVARLSRFPNLLRISVSLYGTTPATHDSVTRVRGSFRDTIEGLRRLRKRRLPVALKFLLLKSNVHEVSDMIALARRERLTFLIDPAITPRYDGTSDNLRDRLDPEALEPLYRGPLRLFLGRGNPGPGDNDFNCFCARGNAAVSASGEVWPCIAAPVPSGNIRHRSFLKIWNDSPVFRKIRNLGLSDFRTCAPCRLKAWCHRNPGNAYLSCGDYTGADPWTCGEAEVIRRILG